MEKTLIFYATQKKFEKYSIQFESAGNLVIHMKVYETNLGYLSLFICIISYTASCY